MYYFCGENKALISCAFTVQLIYTFVFAYTKSRISHNAAHMQPVMDQVSLHSLNKENSTQFEILSHYSMVEAFCSAFRI